MNSGQWSKIETICLKALGLGEKDRKTFVEEICGDDTDLLNEVNSLLSQTDQESSFLNQPLVNISSLDTTIIDKPFKVSTIGSYRIVREIGAGGMGKVFLAARNDDHFDQYAAIKIIRNELVSDDSVRRFHAERQILASLNHTNIARLLDGGATESALPWFAMEYIEGIPITRYCDHHKSPVQKRLSLFLSVCNAIQYAHQNLVVHRDLKPGNILMTNDGTPKVLDFGIAKLIQEGPDAAPFQTRGQLMTVEYASPEQNRGGTISTATDIYSLGVILFELLSGSLPYNFEGKSSVEIDEMFQGSGTKNPSEYINSSNEPEAAGRRATTPEKLKRRLKGDLDSIVSKALRYEPSERYSSVEQFSNDIRRYLDGRPVLARNRTFIYQSRKFLKRNRWRVGVPAALLLLILGFSTFSWYQSGIIKERSVELEMERDRARSISSFLIDLFESADPSLAGDVNITAKELLERGVARIEEDLEGQPELQSDLYFVISDVYEQLGQYDEAVFLAEKALQGWMADSDNSQTEIARAWHRLGWLQFQQGDYSSSDSLLNGSLNLMISNTDSDPLDVARTLNDLAVLNQAQGNYEVTDSLLTEALNIRKNTLGETHESVGVVLSNIAALRWRMGDLEDAEQFMREAVDIFLTVDYDNLRTAVAMTNLAAILVTKGEYLQAEPFYRDALEIRYKLVGEEHPDVAYSLAHLGNLLRLNKKYDEAEEMLIQAHELRKKLLGGNHILTGDSKRTLGLLYYDVENYQKAELYFHDTISLYREILPGQHVRLAEVLHLSGNVYTKTFRWDLASKAYQESLEIRQIQYGEDDLRAIETMIQLGLAFQQLNEVNTAKKTLTKSISLLNSLPESGARKRELKIMAENAIASLD